MTFAFLYRNPMGLINRSYLTGLRVKSFPTNVGLVIIRFQLFLLVFFPVFTTLNISSSLIPLTLGNGTANFAAFSFRLSLIALESALALVSCERSSKYCGKGVLEGSSGVEDLTFFSSCALMRFFICIFSAWRFCW